MVDSHVCWLPCSISGTSPGKVRLGLKQWAAEQLGQPDRFGLTEIDSLSAGLRYKILTYVSWPAEESSSPCLSPSSPKRLQRMIANPLTTYAGGLSMMLCDTPAMLPVTSVTPGQAAARLPAQARLGRAHGQHDVLLVRRRQAQPHQGAAAAGPAALQAA